MYFKIGPKEQDEKFSWRIIKNPKSVFEKKIGSLEVTGKFDSNNHYYEGYTSSDEFEFLKLMRKFNFSNYLHPQLSAVCPHNLKGFDSVFRSVLRGNKGTGSPLIDEEFFEKDIFYAIIGPFPYDMSGFIYELFDDYGIKMTFYDSQECSFMALFENKKLMSTTEFFQRIYFLSYFVTKRYNLTGINTEQILKFSNLCKFWIDESKFRNQIINGLSRKNKNLIEVFEYNVIDEEDEEKLEQVNEYLNQESLHDIRHEMIKNYIYIYNVDNKKIIDLGCSECKLLKRFIDEDDENTIEICAIDANPRKINKAKKKFKKNKNVTLINSNILFPNIDNKFIESDFLILSEVIEHFDEKNVRKLLDTVIHFFAPKHIIITTPNIDYNINYGIQEGKFRHKDHKIEYNKEELVNLLNNKLENLYDFQINLINNSSFFVTCQRKQNHQANLKKYKEIKDLYNSQYIETCNYTITNKEISNGFSSLAYQKNGNNIFYMAPTMSPVEYNEKHSNYLEHPDTAFDYYEERGIENLIAEEKYMGSRGYILYFKDLEIAKLLGYNNNLIINSRGGFSFFDSPEIIEEIKKELDSVIEDDFIIFDVEILPWIYKAKKLVMYDFLIPGECAYLKRKYTENKNIINAEKFLKTLKGYTEDKNIEIRPFQILARGNIEKKNEKIYYKNIINGFSQSNFYHMTELELIFKDTKIFKPCNWHMVNTKSEVSKQISIARWRDFCIRGGEGFVYKPYDCINFTDNLYLIQPSLKVRGQDYLRLVYGIDYLNQDYFDIIKYRKVKRKRVLAIQEYIMSMKILKCFLNKNFHELNKSVAGFIGMENAKMSNIDATL